MVHEGGRVAGIRLSGKHRHGVPEEVTFELGLKRVIKISLRQGRRKTDTAGLVLVNYSSPGWR